MAIWGETLLETLDSSFKLCCLVLQFIYIEGINITWIIEDQIPMMIKIFDFLNAHSFSYIASFRISELEKSNNELQIAKIVTETFTMQLELWRNKIKMRRHG